MLFKLEDRKRAWWGDDTSQWSALRVFDWQHFNSYIIPTDLFCNTVLFAKFNLLASFNLHFLANTEEPYTSHDFPLKQGHSVSPHKVWRDLFLKTFHGSWGTILVGGNLLGDCSTGRVNDQIMSRAGEFLKCFFQ